MTVTDDKIITIFCEGKANSLDIHILNKILASLNATSIKIVSSGGKFGFSDVATGYFYPDEPKEKKYLVFRDRDFDKKPTENIGLIKFSKKMYSTHRTCIENYLIDADLIHYYWHKKFSETLKNRNSKWGHGDSPGKETIGQWIETSARNLKDYQAVRWALADLLSTNIALKTTWTGSSGKLPESLKLKDCSTEAKELIANFKKQASPVTKQQFTKNLKQYRHQFYQQEFWQKKQYLVWFNGKDIKKEMSKQKPNYISLEEFFEWAVNAGEVDNFQINNHPDLVKFREKIEQLLNTNSM